MDTEGTAAGGVDKRRDFCSGDSEGGGRGVRGAAQGGIEGTLALARGAAGHA